MYDSEFLRLLEKELVVSLGCTEPVAIAYTAAIAKSYAPGEITSVKVIASPNVIKNAMAVIIPGTAECGVDAAAALGAVAGDYSKELKVLEGLTPGDIARAKALIQAGKVQVQVADNSKILYIEVLVSTSESSARTIIADEHTKVVLIEADGKILLNEADGESGAETGKSSGYEFLSLNSIWEYVQNVNLSDLTIIRQAIELNKTIGMEGLENKYGLQVGKTIKENIGKGVYADDLNSLAMALTASASDARMSGCPLPVMSNSGSGNQGISATLPVVAAGEKLGVTEETLIRAVTLSHLVAIYIKTKIGRLSALCGATASGTGASCGITYLLGGGLEQVETAIKNMQGNVAGMFCDGAKAGCALKLSTCTSTAVQSAIMAVNGISIQPTDGIIASTAEQTIENIGRLATQGSKEVDRIILDIMVNKKAGWEPEQTSAPC